MNPPASQPIVVQKYGGSSVADADGIARVARRVAATRRQGKQVCVVVSAMGETTDQLLALAKSISDTPPRRELDMLLTCGERASMALLSMAVCEQGFESISFTGSQCGIMTNDRHSGARIIEVRPIRVQDELARGKVVIVAGFQGVSYKREITTLGRGGSDTTAVALAAALGAEYCEICTDVDGVYSADPRVVDSARLLEALSHGQMAELAAHGARVLHADAVEFARRSDIALFVRATGAQGGGTRIDALQPATVVAIAGCRELVAVTCHDLPALLGELAEAEVSLLAVSGQRLWFSLDDVPDWPTVRSALLLRFDSRVTIEEGQGAVSAVSDSIGCDPGNVSKALAAALAAQIPVGHVATSPLRITLFCSDAHLDQLIAALHATFCP